MENNGSVQRESWGSKIGFIFAAAGSAIGLGNIWRFPYLAGENGGAAFIFVYLLAVLFIGLSVMLAEFAIGRAGGLDAIGSFKKLAPGTPWWITGALGVFSAFVILSFYGVVGGWTIAYTFKSVSTPLTNLTMESFVNFITNPLQPILWQVVFMALTIIIVILGIQGGIEKWSKVLMPVIFIILLLLIIRGVTLPGSSAGLKFLLNPDFSKINGSVILSALGQAFFSLSLGMGTMITYGSYLSKKENLPSSALTVASLDTLIAILAGFAIFPALFAVGMDPAGGAGLVFATLPSVFDKMPLGALFAAIFFILLCFAALTSSISILECVVAYLKDQLGWSRKNAAIVVGSLITLIGVACSLSNGLWSDFTIVFPGKGALNLMDFLGALTDFLLSVGGLLICLFVAYVWKFNKANAEVTNNGQFTGVWVPIWNFIVKIVAPIVIGFVILNGLGIIG